jgi:hypothetical protein
MKLHFFLHVYFRYFKIYVLLIETPFDLIHHHHHHHQLYNCVRVLDCLTSRLLARLILSFVTMIIFTV